MLEPLAPRIHRQQKSARDDDHRRFVQVVAAAASCDVRAKPAARATLPAAPARGLISVTPPTGAGHPATAPPPPPAITRNRHGPHIAPLFGRPRCRHIIRYKKTTCADRIRLQPRAGSPARAPITSKTSPLTTGSPPSNMRRNPSPFLTSVVRHQRSRSQSHLGTIRREPQAQRQSG